MTRQARPPSPARGWLLRIGALAAVIAAVLLALPRNATPAQGAGQGAAPPAPVFAQGWETDRLIVQYRPGAARALVAAAAGGEDLRYVPELDASVVRIRPGETLAGVLAALRASPHVAFVQPDFRRRISLVPNDPGYDLQQWGPQKINAPAAWDVTTGSASVIIAVIDTGVAAHGELNGRIAPGWDFVNADDNPTDDHGHGTHVAGIAAARGNNNTGMAGMAWGSRVAPYKVLDGSGSGYDSDVAAALVRGIQDGAKIANLSLGGPDASPMLTSAVNQALSAGMVVIAAAGNESGPVSYPAAIPGVIAVSATTSSDGFASYSNFGPEVIVAAPGSSIYSTVPFGICELCDPSGFLRLSGTSMATPHVAGLAALIWSANGGLSNDQVHQIIQTHVVDLGANGRDNQFGFGRINAGAAVQAAAGGGGPTATPSATATPCNSRSCGTPAPVPSPTATPCPRGGCAGPEPPMRFYGVVMLNGQQAPSGATVQARIGGNTCGTGVVVTAGTYQVDVLSAAGQAGCGTNGGTVTFRVNGYAAAQTGTFQAGTSVPLNLSATSGTATATATASPTAPPTQCPRGGCATATPSPAPTPPGCNDRSCQPPPPPPPPPPSPCGRC